MKKITLMIFTVLLSVSAFAQVTTVAADSGQCNGTATLTNNGQLASWKWYQQTTLKQTDGFVIDSLCAGAYMVVRVDTVAHTDTITFTIGNGNPCNYLTASISATNAHSGSCDGSLTVTSNGNNLTYTWSNNSFPNSATVTAVCQGSYYVTVADPNGCQKTAQGFVGTDTSSNPCSNVTLSVSAVNETHQGACDGMLTVTSNSSVLSYAWSDTSLQHSAHVTGVCNGLYTATVTHTNGCIKTAQGFVGTDTTSNPCNSVSVSVSATNETHQGACDGMLTVTSNSSVLSYVWSDTSLQHSAHVTGLCTGLYTVTVTHTNGCVKTGQGYVDSDTTGPCSGFAAYLAFTNESQPGACDGTLTLTASRAFASPMWSDSSFTGTAITGVCAGFYSVTIHDSLGCTASANALVDSTTSNPCQGLTAAITAVNETITGACNGTLSVTANRYIVSYVWSDSTYHTAQVTAVCSGSYSVVLTDSIGCVKTVVATVAADSTVNPCLNFTASVSATNETSAGACDGTLTVTANGTSLSYAWSGSLAPNANVTGVCNGSYSVVVSDPNGCQANASATVGTDSTSNPCLNFTASVSATNETSAGACDGTLTVTANGTSLSYAWSGSLAPNANVTGVCNGSYSVVVSDPNGCQANASATVGTDSTSNPCLNFTASVSATNETSAGACDGTLTAVSSGNQVTYTWSDSTFAGAAITTACNGVYSVVVMDPNGCQATASATVGTDTTFNPCAAFAVSIASTMNQTFSGACNGMASVTVSNGVAPYAYNWGGLSSTTPQFSGLCAGAFYVTVTAANGCSASATGTIGTDVVTGPCNGVTISVALTSTVATAGNCDGIITSAVSGGTAPYTFSWSNGYHTSQLTHACPGYYNVQLVDAMGCLGASSVFVQGDTSVPVPLTISIITNDVDSAGACNGSAHVNAAGGVGPYSILYSNNTSGGQVNNLCAGFYTAFVTDANGLQDSIFFVIGSPENTYTNTQTDPLNDSVVVATLTSDALNSCTIDFSTIDSIAVTGYYLGNNDSIVVLWTIYSVVAGDTMINQIYGAGPFGVYEVVLSIYCEGRAIGDFAKAYGKILVNNQLTGIQAVDKTVSTLVYPNPCSTSFNMTLTEAANVSVTDITGKVILSIRANSGALQIPASNLAKGIYFVIITTNKTREVTKLVKE
ncbi:MAG: T9SS type A sorting domain-containing protein [Bacteroidota bacterium]